MSRQVIRARMILLAVFVIGPAGCLKRDPLYCTPEHTCDLGLPYCDTTGEYNPEHIKNTCVEYPWDAGIVDAMPCVPSCDNNTNVFAGCSPQGSPLTPRDCPLGCHLTEERCEDVDPMNALGPDLDETATAPDVQLTGAAKIDTSLGAVTNGDGSTIDVPHRFVVQSLGSPTIVVFRVNTLSIVNGVTVTGNKALAIVSNGDVVVSGLIEAGGRHDISGPGKRTGTCQGMDGASGAGAGGGGGFAKGAAGGSNSGGTAAGGEGGLAVAEAPGSPLAGGCSGGMTLGAVSSGGGGAIQLVSRTLVKFVGAGSINVGGGGGLNSFDVNGASGGASGGTILIEAPTIALDGSQVVLASQGGGGGVKTSNHATPSSEDGSTGPAPALGGGGMFNPAKGGTASVVPGGADPLSGGGGGGSAGFVRLNSRFGAATVTNGAVIRAHLLEQPIGTR